MPSVHLQIRRPREAVANARDRSMNLQRVLIAMSMLMSAAAARAQSPDHLVVGQFDDGGPVRRLFSSAGLVGASGHGPTIPPGAIIPIVRINLLSSYAQPRFGGYSFSTAGFSGVGFDYAAAPYNLDINLLPGPPAGFSVRTRRLAYGRPAEFAIYTPTGLPRMVEDNDEYAFGTATNGGHVHPLFLLRRPGIVRWDMRFTSDQWANSADYTYFFTSVPGRATLVPIDMSAAFNADVVDSDAGDAPTAFDGSGNVWVLNGLYGTAAGLPVDGRLAGFQLGGPGGARLAGSATNCLLDDGALSLAATVDLQAIGQSDNYLGLEFLVGASGAITAADIVNVTLTYSDSTTRVIAIRQSTADWLPYRPIDTWQQTATPRPWTAVGATGDRSSGFARSTGSAIDLAAGQNHFLFRACTPADSTRTLTSIAFADYTGAGRVGIFAILAIRKAPLAINTTALPPATEGQPYSFSLAAEGTPPFHDWAAMNLPTGLTIDPASGLISGAPATGSASASPYAVDFSVTDSIDDFDASYPPEFANATLSLVVIPGGPPPGDIDGNGMIDAADVDLFVRVLLQLETNPVYVQRCDLNRDLIADGRDIQPFVGLLPP